MCNCTYGSHKRLEDSGREHAAAGEALERVQALLLRAFGARREELAQLQPVAPLEELAATLVACAHA